ncbi:putative translation initiation factor IF-2 [Candidatus Carsonella ruddii HT isolate Thao2000]|uniref:Putative translation initiation factor IF-2 n=1 Tax=Candidatus Carsonella ruddii HT isolate Thao2000 TaxID=1202539 RepID=J3Z1H3_CARRU|nr:GTP-binding protein [Candidatus Carsonella ruddii]AFP84114.1 putative translation initiation factor IF-2 [Candidatus Carsonella ruddii HT isolate Thao2000]
MNDIYIDEFITVKELSILLKIEEIEFIKNVFLKGIIIKKNEVLKFNTAKYLCEKIFNKKVFKKSNINLTSNNNNFFYISIIGNVNSGKTTLIDFIFKNNVSTKEIGKITQTVNILETYFYKKKIFFFDLPGHKIFNKIIETYVEISNLIFLIISVEDDLNDIYNNIKKIININNKNLIICINKIDKNKNKKIYFENYKIFRISSINGYGVKNLIKNSIKYFSSIEKINFLNINNDGILINSYYENNNFITTFFLLKNNFKTKNYIYFKNSKFFIEKIYINDIESEECISPCIFKTKNIYFPIEFFFSIKENNINFIKEAQIEKYYNLNYYYIKSDNHTICISLFDYYNNLKFNNKIIIKIEIGEFTEKDFKKCLNFNYKIILINSKINCFLKKKILKKNIFLKEFLFLNDLIQYFNENYNLNKNEIKIGELLIKEIFPCSKNKKIAGCVVTFGYIDIRNSIKIYKDLKLIFQGKINSLKKNNNIVDNVKLNEECGINIKNFNDIEINMKIVSFLYE